MSHENAQPMEMPKPDPALKRLDVLVGSWTIKGRTLDSKEDNIKGNAVFEWLPGGFFLQQRIELDFAGMIKIHSLELIGYDPETKAFSSNVYSDVSPAPLPYKWELQDDTLTISVSYDLMDATFKGKISKDGNSFSGGWRPNPGADETVNVPYDVGATRVK